MKRISILVTIILAAILLFNSSAFSESSMFDKMIRYFENYGFECDISQIKEQIYPEYGKVSDWYSLSFKNSSETVLVYFDESNRADYIDRFISKDDYPCVTRFGLRFLLCYSGCDDSVLQALQDIPNSTY